MVELADTLVLGTSDFGHGGSMPLTGTRVIKPDLEHIDLFEDPETKRWVAHNPVWQVVTSGNTRGEAMANMGKVMDRYLQTCVTIQ